MKVTINRSTVELVQGDITEQETEAIVNAADTSLLGGGGVDGAIHRAGGPSILEACKKIGGCPTGEARITTAGLLKAKHVIHTVGPVYKNGRREEGALLEKCYHSCLSLASDQKILSLAFPSISTGAYRYPVEEAARVALATTGAYLLQHPEIELVRFVLFDRQTFQAYLRTLEDMSVGE